MNGHAEVAALLRERGATKEKNSLGITDLPEDAVKNLLAVVGQPDFLDRLRHTLNDARRNRPNTDSPEMETRPPHA